MGKSFLNKPIKVPLQLLGKYILEYTRTKCSFLIVDHIFLFFLQLTHNFERFNKNGYFFEKENCKKRLKSRWVNLNWDSIYFALKTRWFCETQFRTNNHLIKDSLMFELSAISILVKFDMAVASAAQWLYHSTYSLWALLYPMSILTHNALYILQKAYLDRINC